MKRAKRGPAPERLITKQKNSWDAINAHTEGGKSYCECGHRGDGPNSQHEDRTKYAPGHGKCTVEGCACTKFGWDHWVADHKEAK